MALKDLLCELQLSNHMAAVCKVDTPLLIQLATCKLHAFSFISFTVSKVINSLDV